MPYALRVRLYDETGALQADTGDESEEFATMPALHAAALALCEEFHGAALLGFQPMQTELLGDSVRGYYQPLAVSHGHGFVVWVAQVDIQVA